MRGLEFQAASKSLSRFASLSRVMESRSIENDGNPELQLHIWLLSCVGPDHRRVDLPSHAWSRGNQSRYRTGLLRCPLVHLLPRNSGALECLGASRFIQVARPVVVQRAAMHGIGSRSGGPAVRRFRSAVRDRRHRRTFQSNRPHLGQTEHGAGEGVAETPTPLSLSHNGCETGFLESGPPKSTTDW
jgi:hypothetical protein